MQNQVLPLSVESSLLKMRLQIKKAGNKNSATNGCGNNIPLICIPLRQWAGKVVQFRISSLQHFILPCMKKCSAIYLRNKPWLQNGLEFELKR